MPWWYKFLWLVKKVNKINVRDIDWTSALLCCSSFYDLSFKIEFSHFLRTAMIQKALDDSIGSHLTSLYMGTHKHCAGVNKCTAELFSVVLWNHILLLDRRSLVLYCSVKHLYSHSHRFCTYPQVHWHKCTGMLWMIVTLTFLLERVWQKYYRSLVGLMGFYNMAK